MATGVFSNRDMILKQENDQRAKLEGEIPARILAARIENFPRHPANPEGGKGRFWMKGRVRPHASDAARLDMVRKGQAGLGRER